MSVFDKSRNASTATIEEPEDIEECAEPEFCPRGSSINKVFKLLSVEVKLKSLGFKSLGFESLEFVTEVPKPLEILKQFEFPERNLIDFKFSTI